VLQLEQLNQKQLHNTDLVLRWFHCWLTVIR